MLEKNITFELKMKIRKYLQYIWNEEKLEELSDQFKIINKLSDSLKDELLLEANGPFLRDLKLFNLNFSEETLRETVNIMTEKRYTPGDLIFTQNDIENQSIFIIRKGEIELFYENEDKMTSVRKLSHGEIFGETRFFSDNGTSFCARSLDFSNVFEIRKEDFMNILQKNKADMERFFQIKDNINLYDDYGDLYLKCASCFQSSHRVRTCPILHYMPNKEIIILKHVYSNDQDRTFSKRRTAKMRIWTTMLKIKSKASLFQKMNLRSFDSNEDDVMSRNEQIEENEEKMETYKNLDEIQDNNGHNKIEQSNNHLESNSELLIEKSCQRQSGTRNSLFKVRTEKSSFSMIESLRHREIGKSETIVINSTIDNSGESPKNEANEKNQILTGFLEIDKMKSYNFYFPDDNVDVVLNRIAFYRMTTLRKKKTKNFKHAKINDFSIETMAYTIDKIKKENINRNPFQKIFFKAKKHIEKLIEEEEFNPEKFKRGLRENYMKMSTIGFFKKIGNLCFGKKYSKKLVLRKRGKKKKYNL